MAGASMHLNSVGLNMTKLYKHNYYVWVCEKKNKSLVYIEDSESQPMGPPSQKQLGLTWKRDHGLKSHLKYWRSGGLNQHPLDCEAKQ